MIKLFFLVAKKNFAILPRYEFETTLLPSVCKIAKKFQFQDVWRRFGRLLAQAISLDNIGGAFFKFFFLFPFSCQLSTITL